ncbi:fused diaminohydroxyphosphoribosylaminopyrimidine deaminase and 5-amino-6-(5-phosphoribosylamino) uracil reductase [Aliivibrio fischeri ES114]|uniref:Riboflavin biosynthesis protein RibD n=1 Tax=Aliivibrio fischeri (strain ATCC 700601 / ES114) TaxID=312309 RepID=Q5E701_ALIF1|nr:bifunctional diaminohydroxyphosphoribosylaminopyrimidine deaminase/5-amino-6-(5-phosphoribosylamino)uracil reductase RibD [Aliivibrio fischeri]AAW85195.1 fused diaminohydroxyphosphoribosylaminopyrimidine deaminase and 5-amino-6-(5-phosphoribosylamino) uracil reductase [Aliivibrio fischeri ES114]KLU77727.1 5-amino-6-(5-phosphoribosylamino)uracil reductase [Aliivibrio fischeri]
MTFTTQDHLMMQKAILLAKQGIYTTAPNPNVGCVLVKNGKIIGEGAHLKAGEPHAEVHALRQAGKEAQGATAYVTLEPCSHYGRTPPCAEGLIKAGVKKVICAMVDPNPQVAGRGLAMLDEAGIETASGLLEADARALNPHFLTRMETGKPFVQLKMAASLDGKTALKNGVSQWITSKEARQDVQRYRAQSGAILSTAKTVIDDDASLNVRWSDLPPSIQESYQQASIRQPMRFILDRQHSLTSDLKLFQASDEVVTISSQNTHPIGTSENHMQCRVDDGQLDLKEVVNKISRDFNVNHIWVEAGATLAASMINDNLVDELIIYLAPKLMGADGRSIINLIGLETMSEAIDLDIKDIRMVGKDIRITATIAR